MMLELPICRDKTGEATFIWVDPRDGAVHVRASKRGADFALLAGEIKRRLNGELTARSVDLAARAAERVLAMVNDRARELASLAWPLGEEPSVGDIAALEERWVDLIASEQALISLDGGEDRKEPLLTGETHDARYVVYSFTAGDGRTFRHETDDEDDLNAFQRGVEDAIGGLESGDFTGTRQECERCLLALDIKAAAMDASGGKVAEGIYDLLLKRIAMIEARLVASPAADAGELAAKLRVAFYYLDKQDRGTEPWHCVRAALLDAERWAAAETVRPPALVGDAAAGEEAERKHA